MNQILHNRTRQLKRNTTTLAQLQQQKLINPTMVRRARRRQRTPWELAKPTLKREYLAGTITDDMAPRDVWQSNPLYLAVKYERFRDNFRAMKNTIRERQERADDEAELLQNDLGLYDLARSNPDRWNGSDAEQLLKQDLAALEGPLQPKVLWETRDEYKKFTLKQFREHIQQEQRSKRETNYWIVRRKKQLGLILDEHEEAKEDYDNEDDEEGGDDVAGVDIVV